MSRDLSRRKFLEKLAAGTTAQAAWPLLGSVARGAANVLPHRVLGRTGANVSILAFGCGSAFLSYKDEDRALEVLNHVLDLGITYLDTAYMYGDGTSEMRVGKLMATRRQEVFLATKIRDRSRDDFLRRLEGSLTRLQVSHADLVHIHSLGHQEDLDRIEAPDGALRGLLEAREQKMTRFIGMSCHTDGAVLAQAIERHDLDCVQMALNASRNSLFEEVALPAARKKNLGIIAMKVTGHEHLLGTEPGKSDVDSLLRYSLSLPVTVAVVGMPKPEFIEHNAELARNFTPLSPDEMGRLRQNLASSRASLEKKLDGHVDGSTSRPEVFCA